MEKSRVEKFISNCKPTEEKVYNPLTKEDIETKKNIIEYLLKHKEIVNYTERVYNKLECILNEMLGGK